MGATLNVIGLHISVNNRCCHFKNNSFQRASDGKDCGVETHAVKLYEQDSSNTYRRLLCAIGLGRTNALNFGGGWVLLYVAPHHSVVVTCPEAEVRRTSPEQGPELAVCQAELHLKLPDRS